MDVRTARAELKDNPYMLLPAPSRYGKDAPTAIDLFSGAGGITLGLVNAGFRVVLASDIWAPAALTHSRNFPRIPFVEDDVRRLNGKRIRDVTDLERGELDLLVGGPPCQGFSIIGGRDASDPRNGLFRDFMRLAKDLQPRAIVIENVPGLATLAGGGVLKEIRDAFTDAGYSGACAELVAAQYGVPQLRWRMFFIGWRKDLGHTSGGFPVPSHGTSRIGELLPNRTLQPHETRGFLTTFDAIGDLPPVAPGEACHAYLGAPTTPFQRAMRATLRDELHNHYAPKLSPQNLERIRALKPGQDWRDLPRDLLPNSMKRALQKDHTRRYRRMTWKGVPRSIITRFRDPKSGEYTHPEQDRTISIREAARIQSFPDWFEFAGSNSERYDQVGNAVPPLLAKAIGLEIRGILVGERKPGPPPKSRYQMPATRQMQLTPNP